MLGMGERKAWRKTPFQILSLFEYHKEYNPHIFHRDKKNTYHADGLDAIDEALGGF